MSRPRFRALLFAAGRGERLRPISRALPKPLLPVCGATAIERSLATLERCGCEAVAINLHHLGGSISDLLGERFGSLEIEYSEEPELLGTWGALKKLRHFFRDCEAVVLINGDSVCRWPLATLLRKHERQGAIATLLLSARVPAEHYGGGVPIDDRGRVLGLRCEVPTAARRLAFSGMQVLHPSVLERLREGPESGDLITHLHQPELRRGSMVRSHVTRRPWHDLGTPERYLAGVLDWARGRLRWRRSWIAPQAVVEPGAKVRSAVVERGATVGSGAVIERSLVMGGAKVGAESHLEGVVIAPGTEVPPGSRLGSRVVSPLSLGRDPKAQDSVVGELVLTPMGFPESGAKRPSLA